MNSNLLKEREQQILTLMAKNYTNKKIAEVIHVSVHTIKANNVVIFEKLNAHSRTEAVVKAIKYGYIEI